ARQGVGWGGRAGGWYRSAERGGAPRASDGRRGSSLRRGTHRPAPGPGARQRWKRHARVRSETDSWLCLLAPLLDSFPDRWDNIGVGGAAAQIATHALADLIVVEGDVRSRQIIAHPAWPAGLGLAQ